MPDTVMPSQVWFSAALAACSSSVRSSSAVFGLVSETVKSAGLSKIFFSSEEVSSSVASSVFSDGSTSSSTVAPGIRSPNLSFSIPPALSFWAVSSAGTSEAAGSSA